MSIEVPRLPLEVGESITLEQLFKHVGQYLVEQGMVPEEFENDEWAIRMAGQMKEDLAIPDPKIVDDKGEK